MLQTFWYQKENAKSLNSMGFLTSRKLVLDDEARAYQGFIYRLVNSLRVWVVTKKINKEIFFFFCMQLLSIYFVRDVPTEIDKLEGNFHSKMEWFWAWDITASLLFLAIFSSSNSISQKGMANVGSKMQIESYVDWRDTL